MVKEILVEHSLDENKMKLFVKFEYDKDAIVLVKTIAHFKGVGYIKAGISATTKALLVDKKHL